MARSEVARVATIELAVCSAGGSTTIIATRASEYKNTPPQEVTNSQFDAGGRDRRSGKYLSTRLSWLGSSNKSTMLKDTRRMTDARRQATATTGEAAEQGVHIRCATIALDNYIQTSTEETNT
jgi:hypothetical protein